MPLTRMMFASLYLQLSNIIQDSIIIFLLFEAQTRTIRMTKNATMRQSDEEGALKD